LSYICCTSISRQATKTPGAGEVSIQIDDNVDIKIIYNYSVLSAHFFQRIETTQRMIRLQRILFFRFYPLVSYHPLGRIII